MGRREKFVPDTTEGEDLNEVERPIELVPDHRPGPQGILLEDERQALIPTLINTAYAAVKDPQDLELAKLHWGKGIQIQSSDPNADDLVRRTGIPARQIKYRLEKAKKAILKAIGVSK
jgi:hypothetical protein